jgi:inhibitor of cysteine peptidase
MWCGAPEGVMDQEMAYLRVLGAVAGYAVENDELTLFDADDQALLVFAPQTGAGDEGESDGTEIGKPNVTIDEIELLVMESFPVQVAALVRGNLPNGCAVLDDVSAVRTDEGFAIEVVTHKEGDFCTAALVPFEERVALDVLGLPAGTYTVRAGEVSSEFTLSVDNRAVDSQSTEGRPVNDRPVNNREADDQASTGDTAYAHDLRGTVTGIEIGADGLQVALTDGERAYSVTISAMQAEIFGRWEGIQPGVELVVSGPIVHGMEPTLVVAHKVVVVGSDSDYVSNLRATVTNVQAGTKGITAEVCTEDGTNYRVTIDPATTELVYLGEGSELQVGAPVLVSGELFCLIEKRITADVAVVQPASPAGTA